MVSRRALLRSVGAGALGALAGCNALPVVGDDGRTATALHSEVVHARSRWGEAVAVGGDLLVVGAPRAFNRAGSLAGAAFVFEHAGGEWVKRARLRPPSDDLAPPTADVHGRLRFGTYVAVEGDVAVVGSSDLPAVYWYERDGGAWDLAGSLHPGSGKPEDCYLHSIGFDGRTFAAATACRTENDALTGAVHVYDARDDWPKAAELRRPDARTWGRFGYSVEVDGDRLAVAATGGGDRRNARRPFVYVYERAEAGWTLASELRPDVPAAHAGLADHDALAASGDVLALGNVVGDDGTRHVLVYERAGGEWTRRATLRPAVLPDTAAFGQAVALRDGALVATSPHAGVDGDGGVDGAAFRYDRSGGDWALSRRYSNSRVVDPGQFGLAADLSESRLAVGGRQDREDLTDRPTVYVFPQ
ncbi:MAG: hypothetical protein ABEJ90_03040 [Halobacterium sp.]